MKIYLSVCLFQRSRIGYFPDSEILTFKTKLSTKPFFVKVNLICMRIINQFSTNGFGLSLALKQKLTEAWDDSEMALERGLKPIAPLKNALYLSVRVFTTKVLTGDTIFKSPTGNGTAILRGQPSHAKVKAYASISNLKLGKINE